MFLKIMWNYPFGKKKDFKKPLLIMKLTAILLFAACMQVSATGFSQKITLSQNNVSLKKVFKEIENQSGYQFFYRDKLLRQAGDVSIHVTNASIEEALNECFKNQPLTYSILDKIIVVKAKPTVPVAIQALAILPAVPLNIISGTVKDEKGDPLAGVSVVLKGTNKGTSTDVNGHFTIDANVGEVLEFTIVGYSKKSVRVGSNNNLNVQLEVEVMTGNDIVVVGYGTQKKINLTGAVSSVDSKQLENRPVTSVTNALEGTMAGVTIVSNNGQPGRDGGQINIRGIGTLNNSDPMVVIDGVISTVSDMDAMNPEDIDNISVLKDAASSSIYGSRGANGVIVITTKRGRKGSSQITYSDYFGKQNATAQPDFLPSWQAATLYNQAKINEGGSALYTPDQIQKFKDGTDPYNYPNTDWYKLFYNGNGFQQNHYLSASGGSDKTQYALSLGYFDQNGLTQKATTHRYTSRLNLTSNVNEKLTVNAFLSFSDQPLTEPQSSFPGYSGFSEVFNILNNISRMIPYKYADGNYAHLTEGNPIAWINSPSFNDQTAYNFSGTVGANWTITKNLYFNPSLSYKLIQNQNNNFISSIQYYNSDGTPSGNANLATATDTYNSTTIITPQALLNYKIDLGDHHIKALMGYSQEATKYYSLQGYGQGYLNNSLSSLNLASPAGQTSTSDSYEIGLQSIFGRVNYDYMGKYLLEGDLRDDGSSRFAPDKRWGLFPAVSAGWRLSEEDFFKSAKSVFPNVKLRGSWGQLGNQNIGANYPYISTINSGQNYPFGGEIQGGVAPVNGANIDITWETTTESDLGLDLDFLNKFNFSADYFIKNTTGILYNLPVAATYGLVAPVQNTSSMRNNGWEMTLAYHDHIGKLNLNIAGNVSFIKNVVTGLGPSPSPVINGPTITKVGLPYNALWGYKSEGIFQDTAEINNHATQNFGHPTGPGDLIYKDQNGDGVIDGNDKVYLGTMFPKVAFGLNINLNWRQFDFTAFFQGVAGSRNLISGSILGTNSNSSGKPTSALLNSWSPDNTKTNFPRLWMTYTQNDPSINPSSFWVRNASYVRLKNLELGYNLPANWATKIHVRKLRVYYEGQNIVTLTSFYKWVDPEAPLNGTGFSYPQVKVNSLGLNVTF